MAVVILGGLATSTLLNLFVVPALYLRFGRGRAQSGPSTEHRRPGRPTLGGRPGRMARGRPGHTARGGLIRHRRRNHHPRIRSPVPGTGARITW